jgi:hypothetical protein
MDRMVDPEEIEDALTRFDGRRMASLRLLVERGVSRAGVGALIDALPGRHEIGASWMLKALGEKGALTPEDLAPVFRSLPHLGEADAILHVLQMVRMDPVAARVIRDRIVPFAGHDRLLVTVWAFDAYCRTAKGAEEEADRDARIRQGLTNRSKAMRARARALAREFSVDG